ncbi:MAG: response regulator [Firmicutes bacterium]|nr:response regulator [Bacillota bacterium]
MKRKSSIRKKIIWIVVIAAAVPIFTFFLINENMFYGYFREVLYKEQSDTARQVADRIGFFLKGAEDILATKTESYEFRQQDPEKIKYNIQMIPRRFPFFTEVEYYDKNGVLKVSVKKADETGSVEVIPIAGRAALDQKMQAEAVKKGKTVSSVYYDHTGRPMVDVVIAAKGENGEISGFLSGKLELEQIRKQVRGLYTDKHSYAFIVDSEGKLILHPGSTRLRKDYEWSAVPPVKAMIEKNWSIEDYKLLSYINSEGISVIGIGAIIPGTGWGLVLERQHIEVFSEIMKFFWISLAVSMVILLIFVLISYRFIKNMLSPYDRLFEGVEAITGGNLEYRLDLKTGDEVQDLAEAFDRMTQSLSQHSDEVNRVMEELKAKKKELEITNLHLQEASRLKSEFLANMSHELRTPMNTIIGYTSIMIDGIYGELSSKQESSLKKIYQNARNLSHLIDDILDLSKIDAGKMPLFKERFTISQVVSEIEQYYQPRIAEKNLKLIINLIHDPEIETDRSKVKQVLDHLISNAVKFTQNGTITVSTEKTEMEDYLRISVIDTGIGIESDSLDRIFEEFRQLDGSFTREYGGTGLGLSIVKKILNMLNAKITVKSKVGEGSIFNLFLPLRELREQPMADSIRTIQTITEPEVASDISDEDDITKKIILVIDDDPDALVMMRDTVRRTDFRVVGAGTAREGLELARKIRPYLIVTDVFIPDKTGWDVLRELKKDPVTLDIPVFVMSIADERAKGFACGATEYFVKPLDRNIFLNRLSVLKCLKGKKIMIIDDDHGFIENFYLVVREHGFQISSCDNGMEGVRKMKAEKPDLLILDLMMPKFSGFDVLEAMEKEDLTDKIPVIIFSAKEVTREEENLLTGKVVSVIRKSGITREELMPKLRSVFERMWCPSGLYSEAAAEKAE